MSRGLTLVIPLLPAIFPGVRQQDDVDTASLIDNSYTCKHDGIVPFYVLSEVADCTEEHGLDTVLAVMSLQRYRHAPKGAEGNACDMQFGICGHFDIEKEDYM